MLIEGAEYLFLFKNICNYFYVIFCYISEINIASINLGF